MVNNHSWIAPLLFFFFSFGAQDASEQDPVGGAHLNTPFKTTTPFPRPLVSKARKKRHKQPFSVTALPVSLLVRRTHPSKIMLTVGAKLTD